MLEHALSLATRGWPVFPLHSSTAGACSCHLGAECKQAGKHPRTASGFLDASTDEAQVRAWWARWPSANIGLRTGSSATGGAGLWVLDVDPRHGGDASLARLEAERGPIPASCRVITGSGGWHYFFHLGDDEGMPSGTSVVDGVDVRGDGGYVVAPPSVHASGRAYAWERGAVPACLDRAPDWLSETARRRRTHADAAGAFAPPTAERADPAVLRDLQSALAWIPADNRDTWLRVGMALKHGGEEHGAPDTFFRLWCWWAAQSNKFDPVDSARVWRSIEDRGPDGLRLAAIFGMAQDCGWANRDGRREGAVPAELTATREALRPLPPIHGEPVPPHLLEVDGLLGRLCAWINATTPDIQPVGALGASLAALGALYGRRVRTTTNLRTNLYVLLIGDSGTGKDGARSLLKSAFLAAGLGDLLGGEDWRSGQGIVEGLRRSPSLVYMVDEFGDVLASATDPRAPSYLRKILQTLKVLYSAAGGTLLPAESGSSEERGTPITWPHACVLGTSTPGSFYAGLDRARLEDGLGNRLLVLPLNPDPDPNPPVDPAVPNAIREELARHDQEARGTGNVAAAVRQVADCRLAAMEDEAAAMIEDFRGALRRARRERTWHAGAIPPLWQRVAENGTRLALVRACSRQPRRPLILASDIAWGIELASWSVRSLEGQLAIHAGDTPHARACAALRLLLAEAGGGWVQHREALHRSHLSAKDFRAVVETLAEAGEVEVRGTIGRRGCAYRVELQG